MGARMEEERLKSLVEEFLGYLRSTKGYSFHTIEAYRRDLGDFLAFSEGMDPISPHTLRAYLGYLFKRVKRSTILRRLSCLRTFFGFLERRGIVSENPSQEIGGLKREKYLP
ncbi:MAG: site-specific integrase, partial [Desulfatiglandales bacterium]